MPLAQASAFGIIAAGPTGELLEFQEKPEQPAAIPDDPHVAYASMGNYIFNPGVLVELLEEANRHDAPDFGRHIMPILPRRNRAWAYDFARNCIPGVRPCEERGYWRDIGTIDAYYAAQQDVLGPLPRFNLANPEWPIPCRAQRMLGTTHRAKSEPELPHLPASRKFRESGRHAPVASAG